MSTITPPAFLLALLLTGAWFAGAARAAQVVLPCDQPMPARASLAGGSLVASAIGGVGRPTVRLAYLIPNNRTAQPDAVYKLQTTILAYQWWYREQMERNGFGPKTFAYETEPDGATPRVHVVNVNATDAFLRGDIWTRTIDAASAAGVPVWATKQVWWLVPEAHVLNADGTLVGGTALGASFGSGDDPGVGMVGSDGLIRMRPELLFDNRAYNKLVLAELGTFALKQDVTFPWFEGTTFSSVSSSVTGAALHEPSHGFGLPHDFRNDDNFHGNLMGNGLRGWRGAVYPDKYPADHVRLSYGAALALNLSRYFNSTTAYNDQTKPSVTFSVPASPQTVNGLLTLEFSATDSGGLAAAWLLWKGELVGEMTVSGTSATRQFITPYWEANVPAEYAITVFDRQGNRTEVKRTFTVQSTGNSAPRPKIKITPTLPSAGSAVTFDASGSTDANHSISQLKFEWDFDGDGIFDTNPSSAQIATHPFLEPGVYLARCRVTDPAGAAVVSAPIGIRVVAPESKQQQLSMVRTGGTSRFSWPLYPSGYRIQKRPGFETAEPWSDVSGAPLIWGVSNVVSGSIARPREFFRLAK